MRAYAYILENRVKSIVDELGEKAHNQDIILLDYDTNEDIENAKKPLSHASLVKKHLEFRFPILKTLVFNSPIEKNINVKSSRQKKKDTVLNNEDTQTNLFKK